MRFGNEYKKYKKNVRRWLPRLTPWYHEGDLLIISILEQTKGLRASWGGLLIVDNMLWYGKVLAPAPGDLATDGVLALHGRLARSGRFVAATLGVRDGVTVAVKLPA